MIVIFCLVIVQHHLLYYRLMNRWTELQGSDPLDVAQDTIFFKVIQLGYEQGLL